MQVWDNFILLFFLFMFVSGVSAAETIGVMPFRNPSEALFPTASEAVAMKIMKSGEYSLIERSRIDAIIQEQSLGQSGIVDAGQASQVGQVLGCKYIVLGTFTEIRQTGGLEEKSGKHA